LTRQWDAYGRNEVATTNFGGRDLFSFNAVDSLSRLENAFLKIQTTDLPEANTINIFRFDGIEYNTKEAGSFDSLTARARRLLIDWAEGSRNPSGVESGAVCWQSAKYEITDWTTPGAESAGNDYATPSSEDTIATSTSRTAGNLWSWSFTEDGLDWPRGWKDGDYNNYGMVWRIDPAVGADANMLFGSTEHADSDYHPSFYIEYDTPTGNAIFFGANF
jgi:hypothetical protein